MSGCNHNGKYPWRFWWNPRAKPCAPTDRELFHINPKGRPVKQCEHCRGSRKSKSHHVKCDCGDKKDKDKHKDKGDAKGEQLASISDEVSNHTAVNNENRCCCHSGDKCICGVKKDGLDLTLDIGKQTLHAARARPKVSAAHSETTLTVFANGHHQPCHRKNNTAHVSGAPYKLSRPHTLHGAAAFGHLSPGNVYGCSETSPQRAVDTHSLSNLDFYAMLGSGQRAVDSLPITPLTSNLDANGIQDSLFTPQNSMFSPDGNSPSESQLSDGMSTQQWPWTSTINPVNRNLAYGSLSTSPSQDCLPNLDNDWAIPSAGLNNPVWSAGDLPLDPSKLSDTLTQPISHSGESNKLSNPGLTTASSSHSDIGEPVLFGEFNFENPQSAASETIFWEDTPTFRLAASTPNEPRSVPTSMPTFVEDAQPAKQLTTAVTTMASTNPADVTSSFSAADFGEMTAFAMPNNLEDIPNDPWSLEQASINNYPTWI